MEKQPVIKDQEKENGLGIEVTKDILSVRTLIVNVCFIGEQRSKEWTLIDAGMANSADRIIKAAEKRYGKQKPNAIILTHGHFDHVGALDELINYWNVPIYAHELELPYLTGQADYPPGDPTVSSGLMAKLSPLYPHKGIDLGHHVTALPSDGRVPGLREWRWIHTPGHTQGHISLFRDDDRALIAGDAFITVKQESALAVMTQDKEIHGPPAYFTVDWDAAWDSVKKLNDLHPSIVVTGHGQPMQGGDLARGLAKLTRDFDQIAIPDQGRYVY